MKKLLSLFLCFAFLFSVGCGPKGNGQGDVKEVKNIILLIGDGMGTEQIRAGSLYKNGGLYMETLPNRVLVETNNVDGDTTDSGAGGTAIATGVKTRNGYVGKNPAGEDLETIVDIAASLNKKTGLITTEDLMGTTPMDFAGHATSREDYATLAESAATTSNVNLFISTGNVNDMFYLSGYVNITSVNKISASKSNKIIGSFPIDATAESMSDYSFDRMVTEALEYLSKNNPNGFFLMAEGAHIDHGGHANDIYYMLRELLAFDLGVKAAVEWAKKRNDTVVLVTADHETGGLQLAEGVTSANLLDEDDDGNLINVTWNSEHHTNADVYLYLYGLKMDYSEYSSFERADRISNTNVFDIMKSFFVPSNN